MVKISAKWELHMDDNEIAAEVLKVGGGNPSNDCIRQYREKFENDPDWYPGKAAENAKAPGRKKVITKQSQQTIANSAMRAKAQGLEVSAELMYTRCPKATKNPETGEPFTAKVILEVFKILKC